MDRRVYESEIHESTKRGTTTIEREFGQQHLDANPRSTLRVDVKHIWVAGIFQVSEGVVSDLPGGIFVRFKMLDRQH